MDWTFFVGVAGTVVVLVGWVLAFRHRVRQLRAEIVNQLERGDAYNLQLAHNIGSVLGRRPSNNVLEATLQAMEREGILVSDKREGLGGRVYWALLDPDGLDG